MKYLFQPTVEIWDRLKKANRIFLFLDFDGTLSPIVNHPHKATFLKGLKPVLRKLLKREDIIVAIITGRTLKDIKKRVGLRRMLYAGNQGLEIWDGEREYMNNKIPVVYLDILRDIKTRLGNELSDIKGIILEDKGPILAVHYRMVEKKGKGRVKKIVREILRRFVRQNKIKVGEGKEVIEIRPPVRFDKGDAIKYFEKKLCKGKKDITIYIGDDKPDEDAFIALKKKDIGIRVKRSRTSKASFYVRGCDEVKKFLETLITIYKFP